MSGELGDGSFVWNITDEHLISRIHSAESGERFDSPLFQIAQSKWFLRLFPNGTKKKYEGRVSLFLQLCSLPINVSKLKIKLVLECLNSKTEYSDIKNFSEQKEFGGWTGGILGTQDLRDYSELTFTVKINVITQFPIVNDDKLIDNGKRDNTSNNIRNIENKVLTNESRIESMQNMALPSLSKQLESFELSISGLTKQINEMNRSLKSLAIQFNQNKKENIYKINCIKSDIKNIEKTLNIDNHDSNDDGQNDNELKLWFEQQVGLPEYYQVFIENGLEDMNVVVALTMSELNLIGIQKLGHKIKILQQIEKLKNIDAHHELIFNDQISNHVNIDNNHSNDEDSPISTQISSDTFK